MADIKATIAQQARNEVAAEKAERAKNKLKAKLRELDAVETAMQNIKREISDLEVAIEQGNA